MRRLLHILTHSDAPLAMKTIEVQQHQGDLEVKVIDLTLPEVDYLVLLEAIFAADSVTVW